MVQVNRWKNAERYSMSDLLEIMELLRGENGCPWDREQTHTSIRNNLLEEAYEVADAIDRGSDTDMVEELGDLLLQIVFHCQMANERDGFSIDEVTDGICKKLIYRHPHIFGSVEVSTAGEVLENWDKLKLKEKHMSGFTETLQAVPKAFPACARAQKVQKRAAKANMDFASLEDTLSKVEEELRELKQALQNQPQAAAEEYGDLLFSVINTARFLKLDAEEQLALATDKFIDRFARLEQLANTVDVDMKTASPDCLDKLWQQVKADE